MATESGFSNKRWAINGNAENIKGWRLLYRLACMEDDLMMIAAEQRITGQVDDLHLNQLSNIAWSFARAG